MADGEYAPTREQFAVFYDKHFPVQHLVRWLSCGGGDEPFAHREISYTYSGGILARYLSFDSADEFRADLIQKTPVKIDLGAVFSVKPKIRKMHRPDAFVPVSKELVFDIDMSDYDSVRICCKGGQVCAKCWPFMTAAIKVIDTALREDFNFKHLLWVFSGRRGVHCWVCDLEAKALLPAERSSIVKYLGFSLSDGVSRVHPALERAQQLLKPFFENTVLREMELLTNPEQTAKMLASLPEDARKMVQSVLKKHKSSDPRLIWQAIDEKLELKARTLLLQFVYPRLDANVTTGFNHLLKSPFCIHPKTGRVCVPIDPFQAEKFDPAGVPRIDDVLDSNALAPYVEVFARFVRNLEIDCHKQLAAQSNELF